MTQLVNNRYGRLLTRSALQPVYLIIFDGIPTRYSTGPVANAAGVTHTFMRNVGGSGSQITVDEGRASLANLEFGILDQGGEVTNLAFLYQLANRMVTMKAGFVGLPESQYVTTFVGRVLNYTLATDNVTWNFQAVTLLKDERQQIFKALTMLTASATNADVTLTISSTTLFPAATAGIGYLRIENEVISYTGKTGTTFTGCVRGQLGTSPAAHANGAEVKNLIFLSGNPLTLALQILTSTGLGTNGAYDVLPACAGLGIAQALIDVAKFEQQRDYWLNSLTFQFEESVKTEGKKFLEEQIYSFCNAYPVVNGAGLISIRVYAPPLPTEVQETIDDTDLVTPPTFAGNVFDRYFFNELDLSYDYNFITDQYLTRVLYEDSTSQSTFGQTATKKMQSRGMRTTATSVTKIDRFGSRFLKRFSVPAPQLNAKAFYSKRLLELSDIVPLTSTTVPNLATGKIGILSQLMEVISIDPNYMEGLQTYLLLNTGYSYGRKYAAISPSTQAPTNFPTWNNANASQRNFAFISQKINATRGVMSDGSDGYYITP